MLSIKTHNVLDYVGGLLLVLIPAMAGFAGIDAARNVFVFGGIALIAYSLLTKYEFSLLRVLPLGVHMILDVALGFMVMASPILFDYRFLLTGIQESVHYIMGLAVIGLVAITKQKASSSSIVQDIREATGSDHYRRTG